MNFKDWLFINEGMITPATLPPNAFVVCTEDEDAVVFTVNSHDSTSMKINFLNQLKHITNNPNLSDQDLNRGLVDVGNNRLIRIGKLLQQSGNAGLLKTWNVISDKFNKVSEENSILGRMNVISHKTSLGHFWTPHNQAQQGYGPFLYDLAIEYATQNGDGVVPATGIKTIKRINGTFHYGGENSDDSRAVWKYYYERRYDVTHHDLPQTFDNDVPNYLKAIYKKPLNFIPQLKHNRQLKIEPKSQITA